MGNGSFAAKKKATRCDGSGPLKMPDKWLALNETVEKSVGAESGLATTTRADVREAVHLR